MPEVRVIGPLAMMMRPGQAIGSKPGDDCYVTANALLMLHRSAVLKVEDDGQIKLDDDWIRAWAKGTRLGQGPASATSDNLAAKVAARRQAALRALCANGRTSSVTVNAEPEAALVTGTGAGGIRDVGIALHGTYGWPVLPGTTLKGVAHAFARDEARIPAEELDVIFGAPPRGGKPARAGAVTFLDALPGPDGISVVEHVLTRHARGYRQDPNDPRAEPKPPAEYINPVPVPFLALQGGNFLIHLVGPEPEVSKAAELLVDAFGEIGLGAKTTSGYGYLQQVDADADTPAHVGKGGRR